MSFSEVVIELASVQAEGGERGREEGSREGGGMRQRISQDAGTIFI